MSKRDSLSTRIITLGVVLLFAATSVVASILYFGAKSQLNEIGKDELTKSVNMTIGMIDILNDEVENGNMTLGEAQDTLRDRLLGTKDSKDVRPLVPEYKIGDNGYLLAIDQDYKTVMNPTNEGEINKELKSKDGVYINQEFLKTGKEGGFVEYEWEYPGTNKTEPKLVYVKTEPNWGWTIGAGAYESEFNKGLNQIKWLSFFAALGTLLFTSTILFFVTRNLTKVINTIRKGLHQAARGDFTYEDIIVKRKDEIGYLANDFNQMKAKINELVRQIAEATDQVAASSQELTASAEEMTDSSKQTSMDIQMIAEGSAETSRSLEETSASLEQVSVAIQTLAINSAEVSLSGEAVGEQAGNGNQFVQETRQQMVSIHDKVNESSAVLGQLTASSKEIGEITKAITTIADQTNLLSLNAAIEAARAGEHGRGFAVVADEVRKLAEQSQQSSKQIAELVDSIQETIAESTGAMQSVKEEVQVGLEIAEKTESSFQEIVHNMGDLGTKVSEIAATVQEMSASSEGITRTLQTVTVIAKESSIYSQQVAASTEQQFAATEEVTGSSTSLATLAEDLQHQMAGFRV